MLRILASAFIADLVTLPAAAQSPTPVSPGSRATPLVIALHGLGSGTSYMMEYNNLVELAERYGYIVATPLGFNESGWYGARGQDLGMNYEYIEVPGGTHASAGRLNIDKVFAFLDKQRKP
jgi:hypothetical protein